MSKCSGYAGKVSNSGAQRVKAVYPAQGKAKGSKVTRGDDLRTGKGKK